MLECIPNIDETFLLVSTPKGEIVVRMNEVAYIHFHAPVKKKRRKPVHHIGHVISIDDDGLARVILGTGK